MLTQGGYAMQFGTMNEYRILKSRRWLGMPYRLSDGNHHEWFVRALATVCVVAAAIATTMMN